MRRDADPVILDGKLYLLAQLNFSQLPQLRGCPAQGLLQFFIDGEDTLYGADYDNPQSQRSWRVRYLPNVPVTALHANRVVRPRLLPRT